MEEGLIITVMLASMMGLFWSARRYEEAAKRYKEQQAVTDELQERSQRQLDQADANQAREAELLERQEALVARVEAIARHFELRR